MESKGLKTQDVRITLRGENADGEKVYEYHYYDKDIHEELQEELEKLKIRMSELEDWVMRNKTK